jgi:heme-degrading monooxygenase HmoA
VTGQAYTLAMWRVRAGEEEEFVRRWREDLAPYFMQISPGARGTLVRSVEDPSLFYSFGPWDSVEAIRSMRADPRTPEVMRRLFELCTEAKPGVFELVLSLP